MAMRETVRTLDERIIDFTRRHGLRLLRIALGVVFIWFGVLKIAGASPVAGLVADMIPWLPANVAVRGLGVLELLVGLGLMTGIAIRVTLAVFFAQMAGTFAILIVRSPETFDGGNPLRLTLLGEFVVKNIVLLAAGVAIAGTVPKARAGEPVPQILAEGLHDHGESGSD